MFDEQNMVCIRLFLEARELLGLWHVKCQETMKRKRLAFVVLDRVDEVVMLELWRLNWKMKKHRCDLAINSASNLGLECGRAITCHEK